MQNHQQVHIIAWLRLEVRNGKIGNMHYTKVLHIADADTVHL